MREITYGVPGLKLAEQEHDGTTDVKVKKVGNYVWDTDNLAWVKTAGDSDGHVKVDVASATGFPQLTVTDAISTTSYDLNAAAYSGTSAITNDYILDHIQFNFSSTSSRNITVTAGDGTIIWTATGDTSADIMLEDIQKAFNANDNFTIAITQTSGACTVDVLATVYEGTATLGGNPVLDSTSVVSVQANDSPSLDAFGRWRVSDTGNRLDLEFNYDGQEDVADEVTNGNGTITHNANARHNVLANVATGTGDNAAIYSYDVPYTPGSSQLIAITGTLDLAAIGSGTAQLFLRTNVTGSVVENTVDQTSWDDPVATVDWTKSQILEMDFQSLKVGRIRFYLNRSGITTKIHEIVNDNVRNTGYWQLASHPAYWRIYNDATYTYMEMGYGDTNNAIGLRYRIAKNASATMAAICATIKSEGGARIFDMVGYNRAADRGVTAKTISTSLVPLISIRPKSTFNSLPNKALIIPIDYTISTNNPIKVAIIHNCTLTNASWNDVDTSESAVEFDVAATAYSNGHILNTDYIATARNAALSNTGLMGRALLWVRRSTDSGILTLAAIRTGAADSSVLAGLRWREIR